MRISQWQDYKLIDASAGERLEAWGDVVLIRPDPQIIWNTPKKNPLWGNAHARYLRSETGGGRWETAKRLPDSWAIRYQNLTFLIKPMGFKHTGLFPEQATNWDLMSGLIAGREQPVKVLNLFAYTGGATLACLAAGAQVTHVDAAKGMVAWAKENAAASGLADKPVRWIVDDCVKFVEREIRRGNRYDAVIMDPPSYGRGPNGEVWKLEERLFELVELCVQLLSDQTLFFVINSYTTGLAPSCMGYILGSLVQKSFGGTVEFDELGLPVAESGLVLPCGSTALWHL